jgi:hypothetical protein
MANGNELNRQYSKKCKWLIKIHEKCLTFLAVKEIQIKMILRFHLTLIRIVIIKETNINK